MQTLAFSRPSCYRDPYHLFGFSAGWWRPVGFPRNIHLSSWDMWQTLSRIHSILISTLWTPGVGDGQGGLACCDSWGRKESDMTEWLIWSDLFISGLQRHPKARRTKDVPFPSICSWKSQGLSSTLQAPSQLVQHLLFSGEVVCYWYGLGGYVQIPSSHAHMQKHVLHILSQKVFFCGNKEYIHILKV